MSRIGDICSTTTCLLMFTEENEVILTQGGLGRGRGEAKLHRGKTRSISKKKGNIFAIKLATLFFSL